MRLSLLVIVALVALLGVVRLAQDFARPDAMTLFFECVDNMTAHDVSNLEAMSFCKGILDEEE